MDAIKPIWYVQGDVLRLTIYHGNPEEVSMRSDQYASHWSHIMVNGDLPSAYNAIVQSVKETFSLPYLRKMKIPKKQPIAQPSNKSIPLPIIWAGFFFIVGLVLIGMSIGGFLLR